MDEQTKELLEKFMRHDIIQNALKTGRSITGFKDLVSIVIETGDGTGELPDSFRQLFITSNGSGIESDVLERSQKKVAALQLDEEVRRIAQRMVASKIPESTITVASVTPIGEKRGHQQSMRSDDLPDVSDW